MNHKKKQSKLCSVDVAFSKGLNELIKYIRIEFTLSEQMSYDLINALWNEVLTNRDNEYSEPQLKNETKKWL